MKKNLKTWIIACSVMFAVSFQSCVGLLDTEVSPEVLLLPLILYGVQEDTTCIELPLPEDQRVYQR